MIYLKHVDSRAPGAFPAYFGGDYDPWHSHKGKECKQELMADESPVVFDLCSECNSLLYLGGCRTDSLWHHLDRSPIPYFKFNNIGDRDYCNNQKSIYNTEFQKVCDLLCCNVWIDSPFCYLDNPCRSILNLFVAWLTKQATSLLYKYGNV